MTDVWGSTISNGGGFFAYQRCTRVVSEICQRKCEGGPRLLRDWLSPDQREQLDNSGYFEVFGCASGRRYRIYHVKVAPNVYEIDGAGRIKEGLCFLPVGPLATGDVILAQKIALETDEHRAIAVANRFSPTGDLPRWLARQAISGRWL